MLCAKRLKPAPVQTKVNSISTAWMCLAEREAFSTAYHVQCPTDSNQPRWGTARHGWMERTTLQLIHAGNLSPPRLGRAQTLFSHLNPDTNIAERSVPRPIASDRSWSLLHDALLVIYLVRVPFWLGKDICASSLGAWCVARLGTLPLSLEGSGGVRTCPLGRCRTKWLLAQGTGARCCRQPRGVHSPSLQFVAPNNP